MPIYGIFDAQPDGERTTVRFAGGDAPRTVELAVVRADLTQLVEETGRTPIDLDLSEVTHIPGPLLALLATTARQGVPIHIKNPSVDMLEVIKITKFDRFLQLDEPPAEEE